MSSYIKKKKICGAPVCGYIEDEDEEEWYRERLLQAGRKG